MNNARIGCLVMAAGNASRFQANKLTAEFEGKPLICHALDAVPKALFSQVVVVTQYPEIEALAQKYGFTSIRNPHPESGISHTIFLGTEALKDCDAILYMVSDQPLLGEATVGKVVACWKAHPDRIVGAACRGKRGNPCIFPKDFFGELLALQGDRGGNQVIRSHPDRLITVETAPEELTDVDTPAALQTLSSHSKIDRSTDFE